MMEGPCANSEEKREPAGDSHTVAVDSLIALDPERPIREADLGAADPGCPLFTPKSGHAHRSGLQRPLCADCVDLVGVDRL